MVFCPSCAQEDDDKTKFCRACGTVLPGEDLMLRLRQEALQIATGKNGMNLSNTQQETMATMNAVKTNQGNGINRVQNAVHLQTSAQATNDLRSLMHGMDD